MVPKVNMLCSVPFFEPKSYFCAIQQLEFVWFPTELQLPSLVHYFHIFSSTPNFSIYVSILYLKGTCLSMN